MNTPGWYGKLPSLGDFASRRLPQDFLAEWDNWLQRAVMQSQEQLGSRWLETYLTSSIWRFLIGPSALVTGTWGGILLPSVDRVGRYFPLTICAEFSSLGAIAPDELESWFHGLETAARLGLDANTSIDQFDQMLQAIPQNRATENVNSQGTAITEAILNQASFTHFEGTATDSGTLIQTIRCGLFDTHFIGHSLWTCANANIATGGFICRGMPSPGVFARMLEYTPTQPV